MVQMMLLDGNGSEATQLDENHLVNIPVELPDTYGILQDITSTGLAFSQRDKQGTSRLGKKKWQRLKGKENVEMGSVEQQGVVLDMHCKKRQ